MNKFFGGRLMIECLHALHLFHSEAFITSNAERTTTLTDSAPSRSDVRQQSIAVLPPPITITLPLISVMCQTPHWTANRCRYGYGRHLADPITLDRGHERPCADKVGIKVLFHQRFHAADLFTEMTDNPHVENALDLFIQTSSGNGMRGSANA